MVILFCCLWNVCPLVRWIIWIKFKTIVTPASRFIMTKTGCINSALCISMTSNVSFFKAKENIAMPWDKASASTGISIESPFEYRLTSPLNTFALNGVATSKACRLCLIKQIATQNEQLSSVSVIAFFNLLRDNTGNNKNRDIGQISCVHRAYRIKC